MAPAPAATMEEEYDSAADSDFDASLSPSSGDESEASDAATNAKSTSKKRHVDGDGDVQMGSGDEGIVAQGRKKKRKKAKKTGKSKEDEGDDDVEQEDDGEEGVGIRVRLRSGRGGADASKKSLAKSSAATIDVDSIWARMNAPRPRTSHMIPAISSLVDPVPGIQDVQAADTKSDENVGPSKPPPLQSQTITETITIPHSYIFAGETHTSTKVVPANSPEALAYLASKDEIPITSTGPTLRRPLARRGLFDPNPSASIKGRDTAVRADLPASIGGNGAKALATNAKASQWGVNAKGDKAKKLNTVEKSKLDWEKEVERQGIREELERAEKSGESYLGRMDFLGRVEGGLEEESRRIRMAGKT